MITAIRASFPPGVCGVTAGNSDRRDTGTQYTPRTLTESVVEHALAPQVYVGPAEGLPPEQWLLKSASGRFSALKVCDFACRICCLLLVAVRSLPCHFPAARLMEAWAEAQMKHGAGISITPYGDASLGLPARRVNSVGVRISAKSYALRIVVERCLVWSAGLHPPRGRNGESFHYGCLTLQRSKPFTFLDHAIHTRRSHYLKRGPKTTFHVESQREKGAQTVLLQ